MGRKRIVIFIEIEHENLWKEYEEDCWKLYM